jgi:O-antigen/teichoic acid export membrane protein
VSEQTGSSEQLRAAAIEGVRWSSVARPATEVVLLAAMIALARLIPPAEFGRYAIALIAQELAAVIAAEGVGAALVQRSECRHEHLQAGMALSIAIGAGLTVVVVLLAEVAVAPIFGGRTADFVSLMAPLCLISGLGTVSVAILRRQMRFRRLSEIELLSAIGRVAVSVALALSGFGGASLVLGSLAGGAIITAVAWGSAPPPLPRVRAAEARELLRYGLPASLAGVSWVGFRNSDYAIVGARLGAAAAGLYFRAYTLAIDYQKKVSVVMSQVGFPLLSRAQGSAEVAGMRRQMVRLLTLTLFPALILLTLACPLLVPVLFGPRWEGMILPAQILALGGAATLVIDAVGTTLLAAGRTRAILAFGVSHWLVYALSAFVVAPLGIAAVAVDAAVVHTLFVLVAYVLMQQGAAEGPLRCLWRDVAPASVSCLGLAALALPTSFALSAAGTPAALRLLALTIAGAAGYLLALRLCFPAVAHWLLATLERTVPERRGLRWAKQRLALASAGARSAL